MTTRSTISLPTLAAYGAPALPLAVVLLPLYVYVPTFYAETVGVSLSAIGTVLLAARLWDMITDPAVGAMSDRLRGRLGRRRITMAAGAPVFVLAVLMLFMPSPGVGAVYLLVWTMIAYLGATLILVPYSAWGAELTDDYDARTSVTGVRETFTLVGTLLAMSVPLITSSDAETLAVIAWAMTFVLPACLWTCLRVVPEFPVVNTQSRSGKTGWRALADNRAFTRLVAAYLINGVANALPATLFLLFVRHLLVRPEMAGVLLFAYFLSGIVAVPAWLAISRRIGKHRAWCVSMAWAAITFAAVPFLGAGDLTLFFAVVILSGLSLGADLALPAAMQADVVDLDRIATGQSRAGLFFAVWGMATKLALAIAVGLAFPILDVAGFNPNAATQTQAALWCLAILYAGVPVVLKIGAIALVRDFPIGIHDQRALRERLVSPVVNP